MTSFIIDDVPTHSTPKRQRFEKDNQTTQRTPDTKNSKTTWIQHYSEVAFAEFEFNADAVT